MTYNLLEFKIYLCKYSLLLNTYRQDNMTIQSKPVNTQHILVNGKTMSVNPKDWDSVSGKKRIFFVPSQLSGELHIGLDLSGLKITYDDLKKLVFPKNLVYLNLSNIKITAAELNGLNLSDKVQVLILKNNKLCHSTFNWNYQMKQFHLKQFQLKQFQLKQFQLKQFQLEPKSFI